MSYVCFTSLINWGDKAFITQSSAKIKISQQLQGWRQFPQKHLLAFQPGIDSRQKHYLWFCALRLKLTIRARSDIYLWDPLKIWFIRSESGIPFELSGKWFRGPFDKWSQNRILLDSKEGSPRFRWSRFVQSYGWVLWTPLTPLTSNPDIKMIGRHRISFVLVLSVHYTEKVWRSFYDVCTKIISTAIKCFYQGYFYCQQWTNGTTAFNRNLTIGVCFYIIIIFLQRTQLIRLGHYKMFFIFIKLGSTEAW